MEAVGTAVGIASVGIQVCQGLISYYGDWKGYFSDIRSTYDAITDLSKTLKLLESTLGRGDLEKERAEQVDICLQRCEAALKELGETLRRLQEHIMPEGTREKLRSALQRSWYPFKKETLGEVKANVVDVQERLKFALQVLQLDIDTASHKLLVGQGASLAQLLAQNQRMLDVQQSEEFRKIVAWLPAADPWTNHDSARQRHESQTGSWLLQADQYKKWKLDATSHLWMYGKAGCGKTVLCSTAVVDIQEHCRNSADTACAFFYFSFSDEQKQTDSDLLRSLVSQLGWREPGLSMLRQAYANPNRSVLGTDDLEKILLASIRSCNKVFLLTDALDECSEEHDIRQGVLERIEKLTQAASNLKVFATSRELSVVRDSMEFLGSEPLRIATSAVDADIQVYVTNQLSRDRRFDRFQLRTLDLIKTTIVEKADGMYESPTRL
jgi:hypothetical protein